MISFENCAIRAFKLNHTDWKFVSSAKTLTTLHQLKTHAITNLQMYIAITFCVYKVSIYIQMLGSLQAEHSSVLASVYYTQTDMNNVSIQD